MVSPFPPELHQKTLEDLGSFLHQTSRNITEILHRYASVTSSTIENGASSLCPCVSPQEEKSGVSVSTPPTEPLTVDKDGAVAQGVNSTDAAFLKSFMEEILKVSCEWCNKHKAILDERDITAVISNPQHDYAICYEEKRDADGEEAVRDDVGARHNFSTEAPLSTASASPSDEDLSDQLFPGDEEEIQPEQERNSDGNGRDPRALQEENHQPTRVSETAGNSFVTPTRTTRRNSGMSVTNWHAPLSYSKTKAIQIFQPHIEIIDSPEWLPEGWVTEVKTRSSGNSAGTKDKYYIEPVSKRRFRSRTEVSQFLETGRAPNHRKKSNVHRKRSGVSRSRKPEFSSASSKQLIRSERSKNISKANPSLVASTDATSNGAMGNMFLPFRIGRSSESFMHESLASLPFDPFSYSGKTQNADRSGTGRGPQVSKISWLYTEPVASWEPDNWAGYYERSYSPISYDSEPSTKRYRRKYYKQSSARRQ